MANSFIKPGQCLTGSLPSSPIEHKLKPEPALPENSARIASVHNLNVAQKPASDNKAPRAGSAAALLQRAYQIRASLTAKPERPVRCCLAPAVQHDATLPDQAPQDKMSRARSPETDRSSKAGATDRKKGTPPLKVGQFLEPLSRSATLQAPTGHPPKRVLEEICGIQLGPIHDAPAGAARKKTAKGTGPAASHPAGKQPAPISPSSRLLQSTRASQERALAIREERAKAAAPAASHPAGKQPAPISPSSPLLQSKKASENKRVQGAARKAGTADALASCSKKPAKVPAKPAWR